MEQVEPDGYRPLHDKLAFPRTGGCWWQTGIHFNENRRVKRESCTSGRAPRSKGEPLHCAEKRNLPAVNTPSLRKNTNHPHAARRLRTSVLVQRFLCWTRTDHRFWRHDSLCGHPGRDDGPLGRGYLSEPDHPAHIRRSSRLRLWNGEGSASGEGYHQASGCCFYVFGIMRRRALFRNS